LQVDKTTSIDAVRTQYFKLDEALARHEFLAENNYLKFGLLEL